jgi:hypothetical protein
MRSVFFIFCMAAICYTFFEAHVLRAGPWRERWFQFWFPKYPTYDARKIPGNPAFPTRKSGLEAPLRLCDDLTKVIPDHYTVYLHYDHSMEEHKQTVGNATDLDTAMDDMFPASVDSETAMILRGTDYFAKLDDTGLAAVRADLGVDLVECEPRIFLIDSVWSSPSFEMYEEGEELDYLTREKKDCDGCVDPDDL